MLSVVDGMNPNQAEPGKVAANKPARDPRRARNIRTGLWLAALALFFFMLVIFKHKVLGA